MVKLTKIAGLLLVLQFTMGALSAKADDKLYLGVGYGYASLDNHGGSSSGDALGFFAGYKFGSLGIGGFFETSSLLVGNFTKVGVSLDYYPVKAFYIGPRVGQQSILGTSATILGGGAGFNMFVGRSTSLGIDASYLTGSLAEIGIPGTVSSINIMVALKFWM